MTSAPAPLPSLAYDAAPVCEARWSAETKAVVAAAAVVSFVALANWGCVLWMYVQPSFRGRLMLQPLPALEFPLFVLRGALHGGVIAGAVAALKSERVARRVLLAAALGVVALDVYLFASFSIFQSGLRRPREGPDWVYGMAHGGSRLVLTHLVHGLLVIALARGAGRTGGNVAGWSRVTQLVVAAAGVGALMHLIQEAAGISLWIWPSAFKEVGSDPYTVGAIVVVSLRSVLHVATVVGAALSLLWRRHLAGRRLLLAGAGGVLALTAYVQAEFYLAPPDFMSQYRGEAYVRFLVSALGRVITLAAIHVLVIFALTRRHVRGGAAAGTT